uniref:Uncharacterized protein n=1 Tax=Pseudonaja textilis TaxID=8673 RepID=A0A670YZH0_PSETE
MEGSSTTPEASCRFHGTTAELHLPGTPAEWGIGLQLSAWNRGAAVCFAPAPSHPGECL